MVAVKKAAFRFSGWLTTDIRIEDGLIHCRLTPLASGETEEGGQLEHAFRTAVLDEELRADIGTQTDQLRNAILALAFAPVTGKTGQ